jgi:hypothetical protein
LTAAGIEKFTDDWKSRPEFGQWLEGLTNSHNQGVKTVT